jgi:hypothetical protein
MPWLGHFPVFLQNRVLKRKNRQRKAQHQAFATSKQVTKRTIELRRPRNEPPIAAAGLGVPAVYVLEK